MFKRLLARVRSHPVVEVFEQIGKRFEADGSVYYSSAIAFHGFLSLFPLLLLALSGIGFFLSDPVARTEWIGRITEAVPGLEEMLGDTVGAIISNRAGAGIIGAIGLVWTGMGVVEATRFALGRIFRAGSRPGFLKRKAAMLGNLLVLGPLALVGVVLTGVIAGIDAGTPRGFLLESVGWILLTAAMVALFSVSLRLLIRKPGPAWRELWPGAVLAAAGWVLLQLVGAFYITRVVTRATAIYGSLAAVVGLLVLLSLGARLFLYAATLNAVLQERRGV